MLWENMQNRIDETPKNKKTTVMIKFVEVTGETSQEHNLCWPRIPYNPYRILITGSSRPGKTNPLLNPINCQADIDKVYMYAMDLYEPKYNFYIISKRRDVDLKHFNDLKVFIDMKDVCESKHVYWYFIEINFIFQPKVCNGCHNTTQKSMRLSDVVIVTVGRNDFGTLLKVGP